VYIHDDPAFSPISGYQPACSTQSLVPCGARSSAVSVSSKASGSARVDDPGPSESPPPVDCGVGCAVWVGPNTSGTTMHNRDDEDDDSLREDCNIYRGSGVQAVFNIDPMPAPGGSPAPFFVNHQTRVQSLPPLVCNVNQHAHAVSRTMPTVASSIEQASETVHALGPVPSMSPPPWGAQRRLACRLVVLVTTAMAAWQSLAMSHMLCS
jgi:hypothetical protein